MVLQHRKAAVVPSPRAAEGSAEAEAAPAAVLADSRSSQGPGALLTWQHRVLGVPVGCLDLAIALLKYVLKVKASGRSFNIK